MKSYFISHGAPDIIFEISEYTDIIKEIGKLNKQPKAIVVVSAHYESHTQKIGGAHPYKTIYDFYGFQDELYDVKTNYSSDLILADKIISLLEINGVKSVLDSNRGIDHGAWCVLKLMYPEIKIPVITMSIDIALPLEKQYEIGKIIGQLKDEEILILCSGGIVHNLGTVDLGSEDIDEWALNFQEWIKLRVDNWNHEEIFHYKNKAPQWELAVPREEHFIPFIIAMGTGDKKRKGKYLAEKIQYKNLSLDLIEFE